MNQAALYKYALLGRETFTVAYIPSQFFRSLVSPIKVIKITLVKA